jgi:hypothetical protein
MENILVRATLCSKAAKNLAICFTQKNLSSWNKITRSGRRDWSGLLFFIPPTDRPPCTAMHAPKDSRSSYRRHRHLGNLGPMLWFFKYFRRKIQQKKLAFLTQNKAKLCKILIITLIFEKNANFFAENCQKSQKIVIISSTIGWCKPTKSYHPLTWARLTRFITLKLILNRDCKLITHLLCSYLGFARVFCPG